MFTGYPNLVTATFATISNAINTSSFATRFARRKSESDVEEVKGSAPLTMFTQMAEEEDDFDAMQQDDKYSIVNLFAAEILRQKQVER